jgi:hypothetical protein
MKLRGEDGSANITYFGGVTSDEMQAALQLCNNSSAGLDGNKFNLLKNLPGMGK